MCDHRYLDEPNGLLCTHEGEHPAHGHTYESTSSTDDKHPDGGHG